MSDSDYRMPGQETLPKWRQNPAFNHIGLSPDSITALDASEVEEQAIIARLRERTALNRQLYKGANASIQIARLEQHRVDHLSSGELREELADAIDNVTLAQRKVQDAELVQERAQRRIVETAATLARFDNIDQRAAEWQVNQLRQGSHDGMPADLVEVRRAKADASEQHALAEQASALMSDELATARTNAEHAAQARDQAAVAIIGRWCDGIAAQIEQAQQRLYDLRQQALSISSLWIPLSGTTGPVPVSDRVRATLRRGDDRPSVDENLKALAREWFLLLQNDAGATLGD